MRAFFSLGLLLGVMTLSAQTGRPLIQSFPAAKLGTADVTWCAVQDDAGLVYVGASSVLIYDGWRWRRHEVPGTYAIRALAWQGGRLWVGGFGEIGYFDKGPDGLGAFHSLRGLLPAECAEVGDVWQVYPRAEGAVFITHDRVLWWTGARFRSWQVPNQRRLCPMRVGDLLGTGTISGPAPDQTGALLEMTQGGRVPVTVNGAPRTFLEDGDQVALFGFAQGAGYRVGFGPCTGRVLPARP